MLLFHENDTVEPVAENDTLIVRNAVKPKRARKSLEARFSGYIGDYECLECEWGKCVGNEVW